MKIGKLNFGIKRKKCKIRFSFLMNLNSFNNNWNKLSF